MEPKAVPALPWTDAPCLVVTCDVDWASEAIIADCCDTLAGLGVRPLLFSTHASDTLTAREADGAIEVGIHPNFFAGSDQGDTYAEVFDFLLDLHPDARISRSHSYFDNSRIAALLPERGIGHDSNICYYLEAGLAPRRMWTGVNRYPVFWEDDVHWTLSRGFAFGDEDRAAFATPGLKVIDVHPLNFAFNTASAEDYAAVRAMTKTAGPQDLARHRFAGPGVRDYTLALIAFARETGMTTLSAHEMIDAQIAADEGGQQCGSR